MNEAIPKSTTGRVEIWWADARQVPQELDDAARDHDLLERDNDPGLSDRSREARKLLRLILLRLGGHALAHCRIEKSARGRPALSGPELLGHEHLDFSISYSGECIAIAVSDAAPIGIDVEQLRPLKMSANRQQLIMNQAVQHGLDLDPHRNDRHDEEQFLCVWTKLEAIAKARGDGIGAVLTELKTQPGDAPSQLLMAKGACPVVVHSLALENSVAAALARPEASREPRVYSLPHDTPELLRSISASGSST